jgi:hypothetical protein
MRSEQGKLPAHSRHGAAAFDVIVGLTVQGFSFPSELSELLVCSPRSFRDCLVGFSVVSLLSPEALYSLECGIRLQA